MSLTLTTRLIFISLRGYKKGAIEEFYREKFEMLTPTQSKAVAHFLELMAEREDVMIGETQQLYEEKHGKGARPKPISEAEWEESDREIVESSYFSPQGKKELANELKQWREQTEPHDNPAHYALEKYWGRFL